MCNMENVQHGKCATWKMCNIENVQYGKCVTRISTTPKKGNMKQRDKRCNMKRVQHTKRCNIKREQHQKSAIRKVCNTKEVQHEKIST